MDDKRLTAQIAMERLQPFIGKWKTEGTVQMPTGSEVRLDAVDTYEWLPGGYFLIHHVNGFNGGRRSEGNRNHRLSRGRHVCNDVIRQSWERRKL